MMKRVVVITPTIGRPEKLMECISSVNSQDYKGKIRHLVIGDHLAGETADTVRLICEKFGAEFINDERPLDTQYPPARTGRLRNYGVDSSDEPYIAHLDDDNVYHQGHISSLVEIMDKNKEIDIAYCWRRMLKENGEPCHLRRYPWVIPHKEKLAKEVFKLLEEEGIFVWGSEIVRDRIPTKDGDLFHIDSSEWMMRREVFRQVRFLEKATPRQMIYQFTEDYLFCRDAFLKGFKFGCTERVTLDYYIGGYHAFEGHNILEL